MIKLFFKFAQTKVAAWTSALIRTLFMSVLIATPVLAQTSGSTGNPVSRGSLLRKYQWATQGALNLWVNASTGNDINNCTDSNTPCLTIQAAVDKIPPIVRHPVVLTVGSGSYVGANIQNFTFQAVSAANGAYIDINGILTQATPATGTATGTATGGTAGTGATFGTLIDSGQAWTVNNLRGLLILRVGGAGAGETRVISSNTATTITIVGTWTAPAAGASTYVIENWGTVITTGTNAPALPGLAAGAPAGFNIFGGGEGRNNSTAGNIRFQAIKVAPSSGSIAFRSFGTINVALNLSRFEADSALTAFFGGQSIVAMTDTYFSNTNNTTIQIGSNVTVGNGALVATRVLVDGSGAGNNITATGPYGFSFTNSQIRTLANTRTFGISVIGSLGNSLTDSRVDCTSGGSTIGMEVGATSTSGSGSGAVTLNNVVVVDSCTTAARVSKSGLIYDLSTAGSTYSNATNGIVLSLGGRYKASTNTSMTTVTNQITLDSTAPITLATLNAMSPVSYFGLDYGSWIGQ